MNNRTKIDQVVDLVRQYKVVPATVLAERVYGSATRENLQKLQRLVSVCRTKGCKTEGIYCIKGNYVDVSSIFKNGSS
ncbi:hypothetical protein IT084_06655 [Desulfallas sp. Bu1-1]|uniref:hypothetical protein n=1 Tax=Desulfallas sp. Bu1-1 TaxID=2787620 RepID=UPI00189DD7DF|nr:hypothetical protein [Desulfallas sp. Bu1-1]MBF7082656.1 hypothetical protein [Desulfallas sp. Bu1-1]